MIKYLILYICLSISVFAGGNDERSKKEFFEILDQFPIIVVCSDYSKTKKTYQKIQYLKATKPKNPQYVDISIGGFLSIIEPENSICLFAYHTAAVTASQNIMLIYGYDGKICYKFNKKGEKHFTPMEFIEYLESKTKEPSNKNANGEDN